MTQELFKHLFTGKLNRCTPVLSPEKTEKSLHYSSFLYYHSFVIRTAAMIKPIVIRLNGKEDLMPIHLRRHDKKCNVTQVAVSEMIIKIVFTISKTCYMDKKPAFRT